MKIETLRGRLSQIVTSLCKMGSPAGVRLSILLMRRISAEEFLDQLLKPTILGAKSSKVSYFIYLIYEQTYFKI